jgi:hypothetical protein
MFGVIIVKRNMERILSKVKIRLFGFRPAKAEYREPIATDADTMWRLGLMGLLGTYVPNRNIDKGNRR